MKMPSTYFSIRSGAADQFARQMIEAAEKAGAMQIHSDLNDPDVARAFYENFMPDDWDNIVISEHKWIVDAFCEATYVCDFHVKEVQIVWYDHPMWIGVTYHS
jgi:hypothetical protein